MGVASDVNTRHNLISNPLIFPHHTHTMFPEPWVQECFGDVSNGIGPHNFAFLLGFVGGGGGGFYFLLLLLLLGFFL